MWRRDVLALLLTGLAGCAPTAEQQAAALAPSGAIGSTRARQSRRFETSDKVLMLRAAIATLQDLGFTIDESQAEYGIIVGSKIAGGRVRAEIVLSPVEHQQAIIARVTFQAIVPRPGAMLARGQELDDAALYRDFFENLAQSVFLTAHEI
jgi:hypothetical protein